MRGFAESRSRFFIGVRMETKGKPKTKAVKKAAVPKSCEECSRWKSVRKKLRIAELLGTAIEKLKQRFEEKDFKPSVADYLKLVEMQEQLEQGADATKEIKVTWVEPTASGIEK
jgi:hypothetical protein